MTAVFVAMIVGAGASVGVASSLAVYAQRNWSTRGRSAAATTQA